MRFHLDGPSIPDALLERCDAGRVVMLCGAGVSKPAGMPDFVGLTQYVIEFFCPSEDSPIMTAFRPWLESSSAANVPLDQIFNLLHQEYGKDEVNSLVTQRLAVQRPEGTGYEHGLIKRISRDQSGIPQIVTTNFDLLFEANSVGPALIAHQPPAFPDLTFGSTIAGVTYLHGRLAESSAEHHPYVLSSADFGRAYLSEGWATNFMRGLLDRYTVVLVGYQAEDPPIKYLLQGLNHDGHYDRSRLYAFDRGRPDEIEAKWRDRGVTAIAYAEYDDLWKTLDAWANRADDPRAWREAVVATSKHDPKTLAPHERGQLAHVLRSARGARMFAAAKPAPHPEWICVMDANVRLGSPSSSYGEGAQTFDPKLSYGLDDDVASLSGEKSQRLIDKASLIVWREDDDSPSQAHRLGGKQANGYEAMPARLAHLAAWVAQSIEHPVIAWWTIRQNGVHPRLLQQIEWKLAQSVGLDVRARHVWNLIVEHQKDNRNLQWNGEWFDLKRRIGAEGWTESVMRQFRRAATPRVAIARPLGLFQSKPPTSSWPSIHLGELGQFEVKILERHNDELVVPAPMLSIVAEVLEAQLAMARGLLHDVETKYFRSPTCYTGRECEGRETIAKAADGMRWFIQLFDRLSDLSPEVAHARAVTWPVSDPYFFRKLKLYAWNKKKVFLASEVAHELIGLDQESFWSTDATRELVFLLADRWNDFSEQEREQLTERMLAGPPQPAHWSNEEFPKIRDQIAARYARYLEIQGLDLGKVGSERLARVIRSIPGWTDGWAKSIAIQHGGRSGWVGTDETPDAIINLPLDQILSKAKQEMQRDFDSFTESRPFSGLVKAKPRLALAVLSRAGRTGEYPLEFWSSMLRYLPDTIGPRLRRVAMLRVSRLPGAVVRDLGHDLGQWLQDSLESLLAFDGGLAWLVFDHVVEALLWSGTENAGVPEAGVAGEVDAHTYAHAINSPLGMCAVALFRAVPGATHAQNSLLPKGVADRIERIIDAPGEASYDALAIAACNLNWLLHVDPEWTVQSLIPKLSFEHPGSSSAWDGFLSSGELPSRSLREIIKPLLIDLFPRIESPRRESGISEIGAQWLVLMRVFSPDEEGGLTSQEMRSALRSMSGETRARVISFLAQIGQQNGDGWRDFVVPFIDTDWPRELSLRTSVAVKAWIGLLDDTGEYFESVYGALKRFLVEVESTDHSLYRFTQEFGEAAPISVRFPEASLDLMYRITPSVLTTQPFELSQMLELIAESDARLRRDRRYLRLMDLVESNQVG